MTAFIFVDTETTGLDPDSDYLLEVAWCITDENFQPIPGLTRTRVVDHGPRLGDVLAKLKEDSFVEVMHSQSGLTSHLQTGEVTEAEVIADLMMMDLEDLNEKAVHMAGSSVEFDRGFLRANGFGGDLLGPSQDSFTLVHHRLLNLSSVKLMLWAAGREFPESRNDHKHRALSDVKADVAQAQIFKEML